MMVLIISVSIFKKARITGKISSIFNLAFSLISLAYQLTKLYEDRNFQRDKAVVLDVQSTGIQNFFWQLNQSKKLQFWNQQNLKAAITTSVDWQYQQSSAVLALFRNFIVEIKPALITNSCYVQILQILSINYLKESYYIEQNQTTLASIITERLTNIHYAKVQNSRSMQ
ncbi:Hypothetical_protein [Hexamita inflata]|uniref:Hypothetical_protein n=1 Tax=Hexamita inflata TaxID=28002 RepID=A0AA86QD92_9EUKA|nr:Hypothetical protein HINF_LOCUS43498 [Hexamita inflata]